MTPAHHHASCASCYPATLPSGALHAWDFSHTASACSEEVLLCSSNKCLATLSSLSTSSMLGVRYVPPEIVGEGGEGRG